MIGRLFQEELGVGTVLSVAGPVEGESRRPQVRTLAGTGTETLVREGGIVYHLDAARTMFAEGNKEERRRAGLLVRPGEMVADLFAGIGYFTLPAAKFGRPAQLHAVEQDPCPYGYLQRNLVANGVADRVRPHLGDCRKVPLPPGGFDRVFLGLLPSSLPFVPRALELIRPEGGWLHAHLVVGAPRWEREATEAVVAAVERSGGSLQELRPRQVKPYGPSRVHAVVDARARAGRSPH
jgi:tRNA wybutosine-synthesizing protein 2